MEQLEQDIVKLKDEENNYKIRSKLTQFCKDIKDKQGYVEIFKLPRRLKYSREQILWLLGKPFKNTDSVTKILKQETISDTIYDLLTNSMKYLEFNDVYMHNSNLSETWRPISKLLRDGSKANIRIFERRMDIDIEDQFYTCNLYSENMHVNVKDGTFGIDFKGHMKDFDIKVKFSVSDIHDEPHYVLFVLVDIDRYNSWNTIANLDTENIQDLITLLGIEY
jgi:hypothetical protein